MMLEIEYTRVQSGFLLLITFKKLEKGFKKIEEKI